MNKKDIYGITFLCFALSVLWGINIAGKVRVVEGPVPFIESLSWVASKKIFGLNDKNKLENKTKEIIKSSQMAIPRFYDTLRNKSCAVVGSSSNLVGVGYGKLIDQFDVVFRINQAPAGSQYLEDVGAKTTIRFLSWAAIPQLVNDINPESDNQFIILNAINSDNKLSYLLENYPNNLLFLDIDTLTDILLEDSNGKTDKKRSSSGLASVYIVTKLCKNVSIFGFGPDSTGVFGYYYVMQDKKETAFTAHSPVLQDEYLTELEKRGAIKIYQGNRIK